VILFFQSKSLTHSVRTLRCPNLITRFDSIFNQKFDYNYGTQGFIIHPHVFEVNLHPIDFALHYYDLRGTEVTFQNNTNTIAYSRSFSLSIFLISFIFKLFYKNLLMTLRRLITSFLTTRQQNQCLSAFYIIDKVLYFDMRIFR